MYLIKTPGAGAVEGKLSPTVLNSQAVQKSFTANGSYFLSQALPEGSPTHPGLSNWTREGGGSLYYGLEVFFQGGFVIPKPLMPANDGQSLAAYTGADAPMMTVNGELNKLAHNISFGHGIHAGIHWRSDTDTSIQLGEAVALSVLQNRANTYNEKFTVRLEKVDGSVATISNQ